MKYLICNLKANKNLNQILTYEHELRRIPKSDTKIIVCPSNPFMVCFRKDNYILGSQDISKYASGPYTGEVTASQLASLNVKYSLIGHCERKAYFGENENDIVKKIKLCLSAGIKPIYIIGETKEQHDRKKTLFVLEKQIARVLNEFKREEIKNIILVYEPVWTVDGDNILDNSEIEDVINFIKKIIYNYYELDIDVLYGGAINKTNVEELAKIKNIDGILLGKSSLNPETVYDIYNKIKIDNN
ncbi:MAG: triose-phosphate isomerase [Bacilli bacterium]